MAFTNWSAVNTFGDIIALPNTNTNSWFWTGMLYLFYIILIITMYSIAGLEASILISGFLAIILGVLLLYMNLISFTWLMVIVGIELVVFIYSIWSSNKQ